eukprot:3764977-Alexandrium_andersonii.AAC.1
MDHVVRTTFPLAYIAGDIAQPEGGAIRARGRSGLLSDRQARGRPDHAPFGTDSPMRRSMGS